MAQGEAYHAAPNLGEVIVRCLLGSHISRNATKLHKLDNTVRRFADVLTRLHAFLAKASQHVIAAGFDCTRIPQLCGDHTTD